MSLHWTPAKLTACASLASSRMMQSTTIKGSLSAQTSCVMHARWLSRNLFHVGEKAPALGGFGDADKFDEGQQRDRTRRGAHRTHCARQTSGIERERGLRGACGGRGRARTRQLSFACSRLYYCCGKVRQVLDALAVARVLNRTLVLPTLWCGCDRYWNLMSDCRMSGGKGVCRCLNQGAMISERDAPM